SRADAARVPDAPPSRPLRGRPAELPRSGRRGRVGAAGPDRTTSRPRPPERLARRPRDGRARAGGARRRRPRGRVPACPAVPRPGVGAPARVPRVNDSETTFLSAVNSALAKAMRADERVIVLGEDVAEGGPYGATAGLAEEFGRTRVLNTPISEGAVCGVAIGAAQAGPRPVVRVMFLDLLPLAPRPPL